MKRLCAILLALVTAVPAFCCTTAVVTAGASYDGRPLLWKQRDAGDKYNIIANVSGGTYAFTGLFSTSDTLRLRCYGGVNEAGFAIVNNLSTRNGELISKALKECASVEEFDALLQAEAVPRLLSANFGVADSKGGAAYFEAGDSTFVRYDVPDGEIMFRTNFSLSGDLSRGHGYMRYDTMDMLTEPAGCFDPIFFMRAGRTFMKDGRDALRVSNAAAIREHDFIPRGTTVSSIVIECPVKAGEKPLLWCAIGYTPCIYAILAVQGEPLPEALQGGANLAAVELFGRVHTDDGKMVKVRPMRRTVRIVESYESREYRKARRMLRRMRAEGSDAAALVAEYNKGADARFGKFKNRMKL